MNNTANSSAANADNGDEEYVMPCAEALMAGTLALMTGHARCPCAQHRDMMAKKAAANLYALSQHPVLSDGLRAVSIKLHSQWVELIEAERVNSFAVARYSQQLVASQDDFARLELAKAEKHRANWHPTPETIQ